MRAGTRMRILLWHGWLLSGTGSNVATARVAEALRASGHDVLIVGQERHPELLPFLDGWGEIDDVGAVGAITDAGAPPGAGRAVLLRPWIGPVLPVFVYDEYEGFERVVPFVDLTDDELRDYLARNVAALRAAISWHASEAVVAGHVVPGGPVARRATVDTGVPFGVKVHGSDLEYAVRQQDRYRLLAGEALTEAHVVFGPTTEALQRTADLVPETRTRGVVVSPGVDVGAFSPGPRDESLEQAAELLVSDGGLPGGRLAAAGDAVLAAMKGTVPDAAALYDLAAGYDQTRPDADAAAKLRSLARDPGPLVGYLGKLIPQKGVHLLLASLTRLPEVRALVIGFGAWRDRLEAMTVALDRADEAAVTALWSEGGPPPPPSLPPGSGLRSRVTFTGRLDHRYASLAVRAMDVLVVPSTLHEAFGMVAAEGAAAGALPLVARHSGLAEVAAALEDAAAAPGLLSFEPGDGAVEAIAAGIRRLLDLPPVRRARVAAAVRQRVAAQWTWAHAAARYVEAFGT